MTGIEDLGPRGVGVDFWFDPVCPYTWLTSRWLREVERVREIDVRWRVMSLAVLNERRDTDPEDPEGLYGEYMKAHGRVCAAVRERHGNEALGRYFDALGRRVHERQDWSGMTAALAEVGLPAELEDVAMTAEYDAVVRASHAEAVALVGADVGTPVLSVEGVGALFGPVVSPAPRGEAAGRLWDGVVLMAGVECFHEFKRRYGEPDFG
ncbi:MULTISPECIES: mycothiol-dependent nitroreductase Rv2466c family protein [Streptomyces]|uniref:mycothiol-dependent nitroreductase Rv2466c family protein n=1 Tax=Streptomyces TaxID=1883 RepID=UPI001E44FF65|nr:MULTISPECIES: DsbA family protein [Streptomyces]UFQ18153.1 DsbA family protein [Streptomyces huasconensis]WCL87764.1 DsbA family protein [Streptomyces sp. JCM 35825]